MEDTLPRSATQFLEALKKRRLVLALAGGVTVAAALVPAAVMADDSTATQAAGVAADTAWVIVTGCLVMFMQAGFAMLEVGFSRMKNVGTVVAKVVTNLSVSSLAYWAVGFGFAFGAGGVFAFIGGSGFFPTFSPGSQLNLPAIAASTTPAAAKWFFEFVFCAVSLAIVWGTMIERTKFIVYILFGIPFAAFIYPLISHQLFGGGFLMATLGSQDFAGSTVVHLTGATAGLVVVCGVLVIDKYLDDPVGALPAHGLAGIWGTLSCGLFTTPALAKFNGVGQGGLFYTGSFHQLGAQAIAVGVAFVTVFTLSYGLFWIIKKTVGLRVSAGEEMEGLDISEHGMWGYPESFMPVPGGVYRQRRGGRRKDLRDRRRRRGPHSNRRTRSGNGATWRTRHVGALEHS